MFKKLSLFKQSYVALYLMIGIWGHNAVVYANGSTSTSSSPGFQANEGEVIYADTLKVRSVIQVEAESINNASEDAEKDFDKIRQFESYDPATDKWSLIEDFETVEILEDTTQQRKENFIYRSFWAYSAAKKHWYKVDIRDYGYRHRLGNQVTDTGENQQGQESKNFDSAWKNLHVNLSVGGGGSWYEIRPQGLNLIVRDKEYFLQTPSGASEDKAFLIKWFRSPYKKIDRAFNHPIVYNKKVGQTISRNQKFGFRGIGINIPVTFSLHYTFFNRLRLGGGTNFEIVYLNRLKPTGAASSVAAYKLQKPWLYNWRWFGLLGYKIIAKPTSAVVIDTHVGMVYDMGSKFDYSHYLYKSWYANLGVGYERKLNRYLRFTTRLSGDYRAYDDSSHFEEKGSMVKLYHIGLHLDAGLSLNFAKDTSGEETEEIIK
jgi:hypothetical protein